MKHLSPQDFTQNELRNALFHLLAGAPSSPKFGQFYFNQTTNVPYVWNGTSWRSLDAAALTDGTIPIAALATNPLSRTNHTGTQTSSTINDLATTVQAYRLDQFAAPTVSVGFGNQRQINVADPINPQDSATKNYVDGAVQSAAAGIDNKASVRLISTTNLPLSGLATIDGATPVAGDRILATGQTTASANGVYVAATGSWARALDADQNGELTPGAFWFVEEGTTYGKTQWRVNNTGTITLGTTAITIVQFGAAVNYTAGNGLSLTGNAFAVQLQVNSGLLNTASGVAIDTAVVGRKATGTITTDGTNTAFTFTHNLNTKGVVVSFRDANDIAVDIDWTATSANAITVNFGQVQAASTAFSVAVIG